MQRVMAVTGTDKLQLLYEGGQKRWGGMIEGNANVTPYNSGNEAMSSAGETQQRDSSTAATQERGRGRRIREKEKSAALHGDVSMAACQEEMESSYKGR